MKTKKVIQLALRYKYEAGPVFRQHCTAEIANDGENITVGL